MGAMRLIANRDSSIIHIMLAILTIRTMRSAKTIQRNIIQRLLVNWNLQGGAANCR
jgi:hypothetical protein